MLVEGVVKCILFRVWYGWGEVADIQEAYSKVIGRTVVCSISPVDVGGGGGFLEWGDL